MDEKLRDIDETVKDSSDVNNGGRNFPMYKVLQKTLLEFLSEGDGIHALPVYDEDCYPDTNMIDCTIIDAFKFIATAFGHSCVPQAYKIIEQIVSADMIKFGKVRKHSYRFRSRHPLFIDGSTQEKNIRLVSGMVHLGIPILPFFDGENIIKQDKGPDKYLDLLKPKNSDVS